MWKRATCLSCVLLAYSSAYAQFSGDFEGLNGSAAGVVLTGQDGYYIPPNTNSTDQFCFTYANNALGIPQHPCGGNLFVGGTGPAGGTFARAQKDISWSFGTNTAIIGFDILVTFTGTLPTSNNVGSFSIQPFPGSQSMIALAPHLRPQRRPVPRISAPKPASARPEGRSLQLGLVVLTIYLLPGC